ncbi:dTDP-4-dehydrorhamnose 3,5-epimerase family protein [Candidatus Woesebacteria bacterium]|nr:dTDP-4-dehydrorhamnose 3,5-epimerase family protein [Candidatus Woesebacteria bacterium]
MQRVQPFLPSASTLIGDRIHRTPIADLLFIEANRTDDFRGFYAELGILPDLDKVIGRPFVVKQVNHARSEQNVARGFHAEDWDKLITVAHGVCSCVWVDLRRDSETFGMAVSMALGDGDGSVFGSVYVGRGIGNGYVVSTGPADYVYATNALYRERDPQFDQAISLFDPELNVEWPIPRLEMVLSQRDKQAITLAELQQKNK